MGKSRRYYISKDFLTIGKWCFFVVSIPGYYKYNTARCANRAWKYTISITIKDYPDERYD